AADAKNWTRPARRATNHSSSPRLRVRPEGSRLPPRAFALFGYGARVLSRSAGLGQFPTAAGLSRFTRFLATTDNDLHGFAERLAPERPVLDLALRTPSVREVTRVFEEHPETIVLARNGEQVFRALGVLAQPWYMLVSPLTARPDEAVPLLRDAIAELGVQRSLDHLGVHAVAKLGRYEWRGLRELRDAARRFAALLDAGSVSTASRGLGVSRQALAKYVKQRTT
ncbi:MAG TPA: hypothetical protein VHE35_21445, partial [Kofleriaceae bacterium]|nr:hypothetical protein [Kofleriaceae bacterium]